MAGDTHLSPEARGLAAPAARLAGRRIVVVGAGTRASSDPEAPPGNGRAIAVLSAREGARVVCVDMNQAAADETVDKITKEGGRAVALMADVSDAAVCAAAIKQSQETLGGIDGLVLNVGIAAGVRLEGTTAEMWDQTFAVNLRSHFLLCRAALPHMSGGAIVFISSVAGLKPGSQLPAYDTSKAAIFGLCRHVALEGARRGVRANVVVPGLIDTPLGRLASQGRPSRERTPVPLGRQGTAWEVAHATIFLLSNEASYVTGQSIVVDGGLSALM